MEAFGNILGGMLSNSHFGKGPGAREMTNSGSYVGPHTRKLNILNYVKVYDGI